MQKKIIAVAVAALASTAAFAQTNVTVYGVVDASQQFVRSSGATNGVNQSIVGRLETSNSYIGFKGVEDLGNGLKAVFLYESNFAVDNGGALAGGRDSYIGLTGGFGTVVAGNLTHPLRAFGAKTELAPGATNFGTTESITGRFAGTATGAAVRAANAVAYVSPSFSGFTGTVAFVNGENRTNTVGAVQGVDQKAWQVAVDYSNANLWVGVGHHRAIDTGVTALAGSVPTLGAFDGDKAAITRVAAVYTLPTATKLTALYDHTKVDVGNLNAGTAKRHAYSLAVSQGFGKNTVGLAYAASGDYKVGGAKQNDTGAKQITLYYGYDLSKRTSLVARYSKLSNDANVNNVWNVNPVNNGVATGIGSNYTGYMVGLRHNF